MKKLTALLTVCLVLSGCGVRTPDAAYKAEFFAMDTVMMLTVYGDNAETAEKACEEELYRLDSLLSTGGAASEIAAVNKNGGGEVSPETAGLLKRSAELCELTDGAFDITVYPVVSAWGFYSGDYAIPSQGDLLALLELVGSDKLALDGNTVSFAVPGMGSTSGDRQGLTPPTACAQCCAKAG